MRDSRKVIRFSTFSSLKSSNRTTLVVLFGLLFFMLFLSFASVPLYRVFCQKTGFGGTPQITSLLPSYVSKRSVKIHFNTDVDPNLPWVFKPLQEEVVVKLGELGLAFFRVYNSSVEPIVGIASYNVTPDKVGLYFHKIACFCFDEQIIGPGETVDMPVQFFLDPDLDDERGLKDIKAVTLSYTFFLSKDFVWPL